MFQSRRPIDTKSSLSCGLTLAAFVLLGLAILPAHAQATGESNARHLLKENRIEEALTAIDIELKERPHEGPLWLLKGTALSMSDRKDDAVRLFRKMIQDRMEVASAYNNLAVIYTERGDFESAKIALESALRSKPEYGVALRNLGNVYANLAGMSYKRALQLDESDQTLSAKLTHLGDMLGKKFDRHVGPPVSANSADAQLSNSAEPQGDSGKTPARRFDRSSPQVASASRTSTEPVIIPSRSAATSGSDEAATIQFAGSATSAQQPVIIPARAPTIISGQSVSPQPARLHPATPDYAQNTSVHFGSAEPPQAARQPNRSNAAVTLQWKRNATSAPPPAPRTAYYGSSPMETHKAPSPVTLVTAVTAATAGVYCDGARTAGDRCMR